MLGSTVDTCLRQLRRSFGRTSHVLTREVVPQIPSLDSFGDDLVENVFAYSAVLGSCSRQSTEAFEEVPTFSSCR